MARGSSFVRHGASVLSRVSGSHGIDRQHAQPLALRHGVLIRTLRIDRHAVERPGYVHREVTLQDRAGRRDRFARVHRFVAKREREDLRCNLDREMYVATRDNDRKQLPFFCFFFYQTSRRFVKGKIRRFEGEQRRVSEKRVKRKKRIVNGQTSNAVLDILSFFFRRCLCKTRFLLVQERAFVDK